MSACWPPSRLSKAEIEMTCGPLPIPYPKQVFQHVLAHFLSTSVQGTHTDIALPRLLFLSTFLAVFRSKMASFSIT